MSKSPSLRRIQADIRELALEPSDQYYAAPLESDMFEWHFTIRGASGTDFEGGIYHGRILLPADYPFKAPHIMFLTPSGRFETNTKICLSFTAFHNELWQPAWGIRLILEALISFLPTKGDGAIGALDWKSEERQRLAKKSVDFVCSKCGKCSILMKNLQDKILLQQQKEQQHGEKKTSKFQQEIEKLHALQIAAEAAREEKKEKAEKQKGETEEGDEEEKERKEMETEATETKENESDQAQNEELMEHLNDSSLRIIPVDSREEINIDREETSTKILLDTKNNINDQDIKEREERDKERMTLEQQNGGSDDSIVNHGISQNGNNEFISDSTANIIIGCLLVIIWTLYWGILCVIDDMKELEEMFRKSLS